jgi:hypothetical protein
MRKLSREARRAVWRQSKGAQMERRCRLTRFIVAWAGVVALCVGVKAG